MKKLPHFAHSEHERENGEERNAAEMSPRQLITELLKFVGHVNMKMWKESSQSACVQLLSEDHQQRESTAVHQTLDYQHCVEQAEQLHPALRLEDICWSWKLWMGICWSWQVCWLSLWRTGGCWSWKL